MGGQEQEHMLDVARGDVALSKHLKNSLNLLRGKVDDPEFRSLVDDVTSGRRSLRDTFNSPVFARALNPLVDQAVEHYRELPEEERAELANIGEQQFEDLRREEEQAPARRSETDDMDDFNDDNWLR